METRHITNQKEIEDPASIEAMAVVEASRDSSRIWLFGAYTLLVAWGLAFLILFFTDRLPF